MLTSLIWSIMGLPLVALVVTDVARRPIGIGSPDSSSGAPAARPGPSRAASRTDVAEQAASTRGLDEDGQAPRLGACHRLAERRELVSPAALVVHLDARLRGELDDQSVEQ